VPSITCPSRVKKGDTFTITGSDIYVWVKSKDPKIHAIALYKGEATNEYTFSQSECTARGSSIDITVRTTDIERADGSTIDLDYGTYDFVLYCTVSTGSLTVSNPSPSCSVEIVECLSNDDCTGYDPETNIKLVCDCPDKDKCSLHKKNDYTCKPKPTCENNDECAPDWCCTADPNLPAECKEREGECVSQGDIRCDLKYLCDPPEWNVKSEFQ